MARSKGSAEGSYHHYLDQLQETCRLLSLQVGPGLCFLQASLRSYRQCKSDLSIFYPPPTAPWSRGASRGKSWPALSHSLVPLNSDFTMSSGAVLTSSTSFLDCCRGSVLENCARQADAVSMRILFALFLL